MKAFAFGCALLMLASAVAARAPAGVNDAAITGDGYAPHLSDYRFFADLAAGAPTPNVTPYDLNTPLFSDYAEKHRFLYLPAGTSAAYAPDAVLDFPVGAALIKTFGYRDGAGAFRALETRVLLHRAAGWVALPYVWNADHSDADLKRAGTRIPVSFTDPSGGEHSISYAVPNQNQCKDCHGLSGAITPIGPKARNLDDGHRLAAWRARGMITGLPADLQRLPRWDDPAAPIAARARAYLDVNCAHCHNPRGAASNSGLFLEYQRTDPLETGIGKHPVAAGRGSGNLLVDIAPGAPDKSILIYRLESLDPGIAMPELGRATVHREGAKLLRDWIAAMPKDAAAN